MSDVAIREARPEDVDWLIEQTKAFSDFNGTAYPLFDDEAHARASLLGLMSQHFMRLAVRGDERLGFVAGYHMPHPFNPKLVILCEVMWWVAPEHRNSRAGLMLLNAYTEWGKAHANWVTFCLQSNSPVKEETLLKRGYHRHETSYLIEVV